MNRTTLRRGFTIVELLIVVVVIAILAAITIISYNGITSRAKQSAAQTAAEQAAKKVMTYAITNGESYPDSLSDANVTNSDNTSYQYRHNNSTTPGSFCITATYSNVSYYVSSTTMDTTAGACAGHGANGAAVVTNLAKDPRATTLSNLGQGRWASDRFPTYGTYSTISGISNHPASITTAARITVTQARTSLGFHVANNPETTPSGGSGYDALLVVTANQAYTLSAWVRKSGDSAPFRFFVRCASSSSTWDAALSSGASGEATSGSGAWSRVTMTYTTSANCERLAITLRQLGTDMAAVGETIDATGLMITQDSTVHAFADGGSSGWDWNGTPNNSTSVGPGV